MSKKTIILGILLVIWMAVIFFMSQDNGNDSGNKSFDIVSFIVSKYDKITGASLETIKYHESKEFMDKANYVFRKICHFSEFMILSIISFMFIESFNKIKLMLCIMYSILFSILYAITDEIHQSFIDGRVGAVGDVLIDASGAIIGTIIVYLLYKKVIFVKKMQ